MERNEDDHFPLTLMVVAKIGSVLSMIGASITFLTLVAARKLRKRKNNQVIAMLSLSLMGTALVNFLVMSQALSSVGCIMIAMVSYFCYLSAVILMTILAIHLYVELIKVYSQFNFISTKCNILLACIFAYGVPATIIFLSSIIGKNIFGRNSDNACWLQVDTISGLFIVPMLVMVGSNFIIFLFIYRHIRRLSNERKAKMTTARLRALFWIVIVLGLPWMTSSLATVQSEIVSKIFTFLFVVFTNYQGFFMFFLYCLCRQEVREWWLQIINKNACPNKLIRRHSNIVTRDSHIRNSLNSISKKVELLNSSKIQTDRATVMTRTTTVDIAVNYLAVGVLDNDPETHTCNDI
ncbi:uncharacterized protein TRIADDRAFT_57663 [Trichoplax adhaerens]|uniref:G-protein coupled receptors family 2 profile 2 domain-containing protein n=1 Tax=Trichoplax adhaerens TaxID=10228 RepID=B3S028_TRIAD|nr:hypothetical protein TRIADDRAFT_57663 [Trichoplax adhaerens]EDV24316.1 hypothetical protein TRIADDRAFT_57663 [Trichoplax adhaerens]|eukprot:XP_002113842.1 hypothetical protein TRIADDRAFT_57663 [Trichoplax adhaerens]